MERGWRDWTKPSDGLTLLLCPAADFDNVSDGTEMVSISGRKVVKGQDYIDDDTRAGLLAYGIVVRHPDGSNEETS